MKYDTRKLAKMGRRRFLQSLAGLGLSGATLKYMSKESLAQVTSDPTSEVPRLFGLRHTNHEEVVMGAAPKREPIYYTIPRDKWIEVETAQDAGRRVSRLLEAKSVNEQINTAVSTIVSGQHKRKAVIAELITTVIPTANGQERRKTPSISAAELLDILPATITGEVGDGENKHKITDIPVLVRETEETPTAYYNHKYRPVPAGCQSQHPDNIFTEWFGGKCTVCAPAYDNGINEQVLLTAGHCVDGEWGQKAWQPKKPYGGGNLVGKSNRADFQTNSNGDYVVGFDAATILPEDGISGKDRFASDYGDNSYRNIPIVGMLAWDRIVDGEGSGYTLKKQGRTTGLKRGDINNTYPDYKGFRIDADSDGGDSGGPHYRREHYPNYDVTEAYIAGIHNSSNSNGAFATSIEAVEDRWSVTL